VELTEKLNYSSAVALLGFSLILAILRAFNVRDEATRVMVSAPLVAFVTTHIMYLNFYELNYGNLLILNAVLLLFLFCLLCYSSYSFCVPHPTRFMIYDFLIGFCDNKYLIETGMKKNLIEQCKYFIDSNFENWNIT